ncbi:MAG TPA: ABC transporter substrate-binding protein, partial [Symbiobacteriaceae bacterium]|nr:ABC transporter substrate-binding protein [Symbiobacteriaceae bacterium]
MSRTHLAGLIGLLLVTSLTLSACTTRDNTGDGVQSTGVMNVGRPAVGGEVVFAEPSDPTTLAVFWAKSASDYAVINQVYGDGLMRLGFDHKPEPALAETPPVVSSDGRTYTFKVRQGVVFHDGSPLTAYDFAFSYSVVLSPDYVGVYNGAFSMIDSVEAKDDYTLDIVLKAPFAPFLFEGASLPPVPRHIFGSINVKDLPTAKQWQKPVGAGAFKFVEWKFGQYVLLGRNPDYWERGKQRGANGTLGPWIDTVRMRIIADENARVAALEAGELSFLEGAPPAAADRLMSEYKDRFVRYDWDRPGYGFQTFNTEAFPTNIKEVRQALSYGLNREAIRTGVLKGRATVPPGFIPPVSWAFD